MNDTLLSQQKRLSKLTGLNNVGLNESVYVMGHGKVGLDMGSEPCINRTINGGDDRYTDGFITKENSMLPPDEDHQEKK